MVNGMAKMDTKSNATLPHKIKEIYRVMLETTKKYIDDSFMAYSISLYKNKSSTRNAIGFHIDRESKTGNNPDYILFGVLFS